jgi:PncC family amidohydrolase
MMFNEQAIESIKDRLTAKGQKLAIGESVTAGFLQAAFASATQAMEFFEGGITAYTIDQKVKHLGIDRTEGEACNCVSPTIAQQMAQGISRLYGTYWGISATGYATRIPESGNQVYAYFAISANGRIVVEEKIESTQKDAINVQIDYTNKIVERLHRFLNENGA